MGRPPAGDRALTPAEKQRRYRERKKNSTEAIPPVRQSGEISGADVLQCFQNTMLRLQGKSRLKMPLKEHCDWAAEFISFEYTYNYGRKQPSEFDNTLKDARSFLRSADLGRKEIELYLRVVDPPLEEFLDSPVVRRGKPGLWMQLNNLMAAANAVQNLVDQETMKQAKDLGWVHLCKYISIISKRTWNKMGRFPIAVNHKSPICIFVSEVLHFLGIEKTPATVSDVLRGRRHDGVFRSGKENVGKHARSIAHMANS